MRLSDNQLKGLAVMTSSLAVYLLMAGIGLQPERRVAQFINDSYEMIRPLVFETSFSLDDRSVDRSINKPDPIIKKVIKKAAPNAATNSPQQASADAAKTKASEKKGSKEPKVTVDVTDTRQNQDLAEVSGDEGNLGSEAGSPAYYQNAKVADRPKSTSVATNTETEEDPEQKLSPEQWRVLMLNSPSSVLAGKFIQAKKDGQFSETFFYEVSKELVADSSEAKRKVGLQLLEAEPSSMAFVILSHFYSTISVAEEKAEFFKQYLEGYSQTSRHSDLSQVLAGSDELSIQAAFSVIEIMVSKAKDNGAEEESPAKPKGVRTVRYTASGSQITPEAIKKFVPAISKISQGENQNLAGSAQTLLTSLQGLFQS